jgi:sulfite reductase (NADPH) flavoprotein alpha-component
MEPMQRLPQTPGKPLLVLFGSQTGSAEGLARAFAKEAARRGFAPQVLALNEYEKCNFAAGGKAVIISSTWGDGEPPDNASAFWTWLNSAAAPRLENLEFAVLGLGDKNYSDFCGASKKFDERLERLGAKRLLPRGECDVDYDVTAKAWISALWQKLYSGSAPNGTPPETGSQGSISVAADTRSNRSPASGYSKSNPFPARLLKNVLLSGPDSDKEVRHYEISLAGSGLSYSAGDALGVMPVNCPDLVQEILAALRCDAKEQVIVGGLAMPLGDALTRHLDVTRPSQEMFAMVANAVPAADLAALLALEKREELKQWLRARGVLDLLLLLAEPPPPADFVKLLSRLSPRLYSISSSPNAHPGEVHLTVNSVRYHSHGRTRKGVASTFLADRASEDEFVKVYVQSSAGFRLPPAGNTPIIMVGPGTGIAPFRAFLEERSASGAVGRNWLFFGDQKRSSDFLYEEQLTAWVKNGFLTRLDLAFSRDQSNKIYVQHRMLENAAEMWAWLEAGAHFYVCGDAARMAKDVDTALHQIVETAGGRNPEQARAYVTELKAEKRYARDVY